MNPPAKQSIAARRQNAPTLSLASLAPAARREETEAERYMRVHGNTEAPVFQEDQFTLSSENFISSVKNS